MTSLGATLTEHWETLHALLRQYGPLELITAAYEIQEEMTTACEDVAQRAHDMGAGEAYRLGRDLGRQEGWQQRDRQAVRELSEKDSQIAAGTANLTATRQRLEELRVQVGAGASSEELPEAPATDTDQKVH